MTDELKVYEALAASYQKNIALLEKLLSNKITTINLFFQCLELNTLNGFSHQVLFNKANTPPSFIEWMKAYKIQLQAELFFVDQKIHEMKTQPETA